ARAGDRANHARGAWTEVIVLSTRTAGGRTLFRAGFFFFSFVIAITAMAVLTIPKSLRALGLRSGRSDPSLRPQGEQGSSRQTDLHLQNGETGRVFSFTSCVPGSAHTECRETVLSNRIATLGLATDTAFRFQNQRSANIRDAGDGTSLFLTL